MKVESTLRLAPAELLKSVEEVTQNKFVISCRAHFTERGYLSERQQKCLGDMLGHHQTLVDAEEAAPDSTFVAGCRKFFTDTGCLTERQEAVLVEIIEYGPRYGSGGYYDDEDREDESDFDPFDP